MLLHQIRTDRRGVELIANLNIAFVSRHAIGRLHQRQDGLSAWDIDRGADRDWLIGYLTRASEKHCESALHLLCQDVLLVGTSRPALKRDTTARLRQHAVRGADGTASRRGQIARRIGAGPAGRFGSDRMAQERPHDPGPLLATIPALAWHGGDFTSKVAVKG